MSECTRPLDHSVHLDGSRECTIDALCTKVHGVKA